MFSDTELVNLNDDYLEKLYTKLKNDANHLNKNYLDKIHKELSNRKEKMYNRTNELTQRLERERNAVLFHLN